MFDKDKLPKFVSPYRLAKIESAARDRNIPPQKLYGYVRAGYIKATLNDLGKYQIARDEAARYIEMNLAKDEAKKLA